MRVAREGHERRDGANEVRVDLKEMYRFDAKDMVPEITVSRYSNVAYVQVSPRDVYLDFLEMPGVKRDGKVVVNGTRVYMSHVAAQRLAEVLQTTLKKVVREGGIESLKDDRVVRAPSGPQKAR
jgi:hypothetical protein